MEGQGSSGTVGGGDVWSGVVGEVEGREVAVGQGGGRRG